MGRRTLVLVVAALMIFSPILAFTDGNLAISISTKQGEDTSPEKPTWILADIKVYSDLNNWPDDPPAWVRDIELHRFMEWNVSIEERRKGFFYLPVTVNLTFLPPVPGCTPVPVYLKWKLKQCGGRGGGKASFLYIPNYQKFLSTGKLEWKRYHLRGSGMVRVELPDDWNKPEWNATFKCVIHINRQRFYYGYNWRWGSWLTFTLTVHFMDTSKKDHGGVKLT